MGISWGRENVVYWCMPLFLLPYFLSGFLFTQYFYFSLSLHVLFSLFYLLLSCLPLYYSWLPPIILFVIMEFTNCFWLLVGISPGLPTNLLVVQSLPLPRVCWLHHSPFPNKITCLVSYLSLFLFHLNR